MAGRATVPQFIWTTVRVPEIPSQVSEFRRIRLGDGEQHSRTGLWLMRRLLD